MSEKAEEVEEPDVELISGYRTLSDWQLSRVRNALRAYHCYERDHEGNYYTWKDVREAIADYAGVQIGSSPKNGAERLRQFVEGIEIKGSHGERKYPKPQDEALEGIIAFLTHEDLQLLSDDELAEYMPGYQAPLRLLEYLVQDCDTPMTLDAIKVHGAMQSVLRDKDGCTVRKITLQRPDTDGMLQAVETREHFVTQSPKQAMKWSGDHEYEHRTSIMQYGGWAVITPEDSMILFLKCSANGRNHRYICLDELGLALDEHIPDESPLVVTGRRHMRFLQHDYGADLRGADDTARILAGLSQDICLFEWYSMS